MPIAINGTGPITGITSLNTTVSDTELGYLDGVTSGIQSQINTAGGLVLITSQSFSAASSVSVNNCFQSGYANYRVLLNATGSTGSDCSIRLRASGSDNTTSNYTFAYSDVASGINITGTNGGQTSFINIWRNGGSGGSTVAFDILSPALAERTFILSSNYNGDRLFTAGGNFTATTTFDGFSFFPASGTITGTVRVYSYRNS